MPESRENPGFFMRGSMLRAPLGACMVALLSQPGHSSPFLAATAATGARGISERFQLSSLGPNFIQALTEDAEGRLWLGRYGGLNRFDPDSEITLPWWGTWWFRLFALLSIVGLTITAHRFRTRAIRARNVRLEREVHERKQAEESASRSESLLRSIADAIPVAIGFVDSNLRCAFCNLASEGLLGRPRSEIQGRPLEEFLTPEAREAVRAPITQVLAGKKGTYDLELGAGPSGSRRISLTLLPQIESGGIVSGFYVLGLDMTDRVRTEEAVLRHQEELSHTSHVLTLGELAAAFAHELNQPLTAILGNAETARSLRESSTLAGEELAEILGDIADDATRAGQILRRLRDLARRGEVRRDLLDFNGCVRDIEPLLRAAALESEVKLSLDLGPDLPPGLGDAIEIQQVVLNLARNGMEAMHDVPRGVRHLRIRTERAEENFVLEVHDTGPPLEDAKLALMFVPFYTTKPGGLGMGLAVSRSIVEAHGGEIGAKPNPGGGVTVRFTLPLRPEERASVSAARRIGECT